MYLQMSLFSVLIILITINHTVGDPFYRSDYTFAENLGGWVKFHRIPLPWHGARRKCALEGAILSSPLNEHFVSLMHTVMNSSKIPSMYTGVHATFSRGEYYTVDGIPFNERSQNMWQPDGLSYSRSEDRCVVIGNNGLVSLECESAYPYMCFKKTDYFSLNALCGTTDGEYVYEKLTGHCYKVHLTGAEWSKAFEICSAEGGYLAIPFDAAESQFLANLTRSHYLQLSMIGYIDWEGNGDWYTIHGGPIKYTWWSGEHTDGDRRCAAIDGDACLVKKYCSDKHTFICEKNPNSLQKVVFKEEENN